MKSTLHTTCTRRRRTAQHKAKTATCESERIPCVCRLTIHLPMRLSLPLTSRQQSTRGSSMYCVVFKEWFANCHVMPCSCCVQGVFAGRCHVGLLHIDVVKVLRHILACRRVGFAVASLTFAAAFVAISGLIHM